MIHVSDNLVMDIRNEIAAGNLKSGQRLDATRAWAKKYGITAPTAHRALKVLEEEGLVVRRPRSGTFVADSLSLQRRMWQDTVAVIMEGHAHVYTKVQAYLLDQLQAMGKTISVINWNAETGMDGISRQLEDLLKFNPRSVIVQCQVVQKARKTLMSFASKGARMIVAFGLPRDVPDGWYSVAPCEEKMNYLAAKHLFDLGHRHIGFLGLRPEPDISGSNQIYPDAEAGIRRAAEEAGLPGAIESWLMSRSMSAANANEQAISWIQEALARTNRPTALITQMDWKAVLACRAAGRLGLRIPEDISIVGQWNTPWSESMDLTSVSVREDIIARHLARLAQLPNENASDESGYHVIVEPELIKRKSTASLKNQEI